MYNFIKSLTLSLILVQLIILKFIQVTCEYFFTTFGICFKFLTLLVFEISGAQKWVNWILKKNISLLKKNRIPDRYIRYIFRNLDKLQFINVCISLYFILYLCWFSRYKLPKSVAIGLGWVGPGRYIVLNDSASPKMIMKMYSNCFRFFSKDLEFFKCRRDDLNIWLLIRTSFAQLTHNYLNF